MRALARRPRAPRLRRLEHRVPADRARPGRRLAGDVRRRRRGDRPPARRCGAARPRRASRSSATRPVASSRSGRPAGARLPAGAPGARPADRAGRGGVGGRRQRPRAEPTARSRSGAVGVLMGGGPDELPERYAVADPIAHVPLAIPVLLVHGTDDATVSVRRSRNYAQAARAPRRRRRADRDRRARRARTAATSTPTARAGRRSRAGSTHATSPPHARRRAPGSLRRARRDEQLRALVRRPPC